METKKARDAFAQAIDRGTTLSAIIHVAAEESPAVSEGLHWGAVKVSRMIPVERPNASISPRVGEALAGAD